MKRGKEEAQEEVSPGTLTGDACDRKCPGGTFGPSCKKNCTCRPNSRCDVRDGTCYCNQGFLGENCEVGETFVSGESSSFESRESSLYFVKQIKTTHMKQACYGNLCETILPALSTDGNSQIEFGLNSIFVIQF